MNLEKIMDGLDDCDVLEDIMMEDKGLYDPHDSIIWYNPNQIESEDDFYITIIHELMHHHDYDEWLQHGRFDEYARGILAIDENRQCLEMYLSQQAERFRGSLG